MARPSRFEHHKYLGDKRTQIVYDLDMYGSDEHVTERIDDILTAETFLAFCPDTLAEARNRNYRPDRSIRRALATE
jgi:hypothetical protein